MSWAVLSVHARTTEGLWSAALADALELEAVRPEALSPDATLAFCLDEPSLARATQAGVARRIAVIPTFRRPFDSAAATEILVAHDTLRDALPARQKERAHVVGAIAPLGWAPRDARNEAQESASVAPPAILVPSSMIAEHGATAILLQLSLVSGEPTVLFDIGLDVEAAEALRRMAPGHGIEGYLFARTDDASAYWGLADIVVTRAHDNEAALAVAVGAGLVLTDDTPGADALEVSGVATRAIVSTLAVSIDEALGRRDVAQQAALDLDSAGTIARIIEIAKRAESRAPALPRGLPEGLEPLAKEAPKPQDDRPPDATPEGDDDFEARIEDELAALKKRL